MDDNKQEQGGGEPLKQDPGIKQGEVAQQPKQPEKAAPAQPKAPETGFESSTSTGKKRTN